MASLCLRPQQPCTGPPHAPASHSPHPRPQPPNIQPPTPATLLQVYALTAKDPGPAAQQLAYGTRDLLLQMHSTCMAFANEAHQRSAPCALTPGILGMLPPSSSTASQQQGNSHHSQQQQGQQLWRAPVLRDVRNVLDNSFFRLLASFIGDLDKQPMKGASDLELMQVWGGHGVL
jgi:hypothetical protein